MSSDNQEDYSFDNFEMKCGSAISTKCEGKSVAAGKGFTNATFKRFIGGAVNVFTSGLNVFLATSTSGLTINMVKGINAARCAVVNAADNAWNFIAAAWWAAYQFDMQNYVEEGLDTAWPYICTCNEDMDFISRMLGATGAQVAVFASCSESSASVSTTA